MARKPLGDIAPARLDPVTLARNFDDVAPPLDEHQALIAADRCYYCYDAPCIEACPTGIDVPEFIRGIATGNLKGAAETILSANAFGGSCARVCPTEILCEGACVRNTAESKPVQIGALQRHATDWVYKTGTALFERAAESGFSVAVVGAGPAGLACAHRLARAGHAVTVFDAKARAGGLNEYGIAAYKLVDDFARQEIDWLLSIGGISLRAGVRLGQDISLTQLRSGFDAVFLGLGLAGVNALGIADESLPGVENAVDFIARLRQSDDLAAMRVGRRVVVIGGGNTAIDAAVQSRRLGAETVTLVYRRGPEAMSATDHEQAFAKVEGVNVIHWAAPRRLVETDGVLAAIEFEHVRLDADGKLVGSGEGFSLEADTVLKAIGQSFVPDPLRSDGHELLRLRDGRIAVDADFATSLAGVWAGGDCVGGKTDLTVQAVDDGQRAAAAIDRVLATRAQATG